MAFTAEAAVAARTVSGFAALRRDTPLVPWSFERRALRPHDVALDILFCGICHTDLHSIGRWGQEFPLVPGHEIVGRVTDAGADVTRFAPGDLVAVGVIVDSCRCCDPCRNQMETYCQAFPTTTYDGIDRIDGSRTRGGFSDSHVCDERFVYAVPDGLDPARVAPLLCAGVTTYAPLRHWNVGPGSTVGVIGIGGLGHLAINFARALGAHVVAFTGSPAKREDALALGAHEAVLSSDAARMSAQAHRFDFLLDTVPTAYPLEPFLRALRLDGTFCTLGLPDRLELQPIMLAMGRRRIASSGAGGTRETADMLAFCARHRIEADVELVAPGQINDALERLRRNDVKYRFVLDPGRR